MTSSLRIAVIGSGSIGRRHIDNLNFLGIRNISIPYRSYSSDLLNGCDAVIIATGTDVRIGPIADASFRNLPMYIEKPLAFRSSDLSAIYQLTSNVSDRSVLGLMMRYHPAFRVLSELDMSSTVGFSLDIGHDVNKWRSNWIFSNSYASKSCGGGVLLDLCHEIDMACVLFPSLKLNSVSCLGHINYPLVDFASRISFQTSNGAVGSVEMDYLTPQMHRRTIIHGSDVIYDFDFSSQNYVIKNIMGERNINIPMERNEMFLGLTRDWIALIEGRETVNPLIPRIDLVDASAAIIASAWERRQFKGFITKELL